MLTDDERRRWKALDPQRQELTANLYDMRAVLKNVKPEDEFYPVARRWLDAINPTIRFIETTSEGEK